MYDLLNNDLQISPTAQSFLGESARWGKFLSIIGFIFCGFMLVIALLFPAFLANISPYSALSPNMGVGLGIAYFVMAVLLFFPCLYLYRFSVKMQSSLNVINQENFEASLKNLKSMFRFYGICTIVLLSLYAMIFVVAMLTAAMKG